MKKEEAFQKSLPKWPQMLVTGKSVPVELAEEIILRTDSFFGPWGGGNNQNFDQKVRKLFVGYEEYPNTYDEQSHLQDRQEAIEKALEIETDENELQKLRNELEANKARVQELFDEREAYYTAFEDFNRKVGRIETEYVCNSWFSSPFIGGPHGWIHPDGTIGFTDNVGKWPSVRSIYEDWKKIAKAYPQLEIKVTLMNGESCDDCTSPVVTMEIKNGKIKFTENHIGSEDYPNSGRVAGADVLEQIKNFGGVDDSRENYYSLEYIINRFVPLAQKRIKEFEKEEKCI